MSLHWRHGLTAPRYAPLVGALIGAVGGIVYWLGAQIWPTSIAVVLSMLATVLLSERAAVGRALGPVGFVFAVLVKYNALMALSAASLPFTLPPNVALGLIMIAGQASSRALGVSLIGSAAPSSGTPASHGDLAIALALGFAPAALIGIPGLIGLVAAIVARVACAAYIGRRRASVTAAGRGMIQPLAEISFYLGALGSWSYI